MMPATQWVLPEIISAKTVARREGFLAKFTTHRYQRMQQITLINRRLGVSVTWPFLKKLARAQPAMQIVYIPG